MDRPASPHHEAYTKGWVESTAELHETPLPQSQPHQSYPSGRSSPSNDSLSEPEFGLHYTTSPARSFPHRYHELSHNEFVARLWSSIPGSEQDATPRFRRSRTGNAEFLLRSTIGTSEPYQMLTQPGIVPHGRYENVETKASLDSSSPEHGGSSLYSKATDTASSSPTGTATQHAGDTTEDTVVTTLSRAFVSKCALEHSVAQATYNLQEGRLDRETCSSLERGPIVNHYPQPERRYDVESAIANADRFFDSLSSTEAVESVKESLHQIPTPAIMETDRTAQVASARIDYWDSASEALYKGNSPTSTTLQTPIPSTGENSRVKTRPIDGNNEQSNHAQTSGASLFHSSVSGNQSGPVRPGARGGSRRERRGPYDRPNPQSTPGAQSPSNWKIPWLPCVYHHPGNARMDITPDCATKHVFVSHIR